MFKWFNSISVVGGTISRTKLGLECEFRTLFNSEIECIQIWQNLKKLGKSRYATYDYSSELYMMHHLHLIVIQNQMLPHHWYHLLAACWFLVTARWTLNFLALKNNAVQNVTVVQVKRPPSPKSVEYRYHTTSDNFQFV